MEGLLPIIRRKRRPLVSDVEPKRESEKPATVLPKAVNVEPPGGAKSESDEPAVESSE